jgi:CRP-like cAMP-binding protein
MNPSSSIRSKSETAPCGETAWPLQAPDELVRALASAGQMRRVTKGARLFSFGEAASGVFLILKGAVRASLQGEPGDELLCHIAGPGAVLGLSSALCATRYQFDVEALETVEAIHLGTEAVNDILRQHPEICMRVMNMMCDELTSLRQTRKHMQSCGKRSCSLHRSCTCGPTLQ